MEAQEVKSEDDEKISKQVDKLNSVKFDLTKEPPKDIELMRYAGASICSAGNLHGISGLAGIGKSAIITAGIASILFAEDHTPDFLGWDKGRDKKDGAVLHFDTEQSPYHHYQMCKRILWRAFTADVVPVRFESYIMAGWNVQLSLEHIPIAIDKAAQREGGVHSIWIDGIGDIVTSVNDEAECNERVAWLHSLAIKYECSIWSVIHVNPNQKGGTKTRGHLGSQLERKAENILLLDAKKDYIEVKSSKQRREGAKEYRFRWDEDEKKHISVSMSNDINPYAYEHYLDLCDAFKVMGVTTTRFSKLVEALKQVCPENKEVTFKSWIKKALETKCLARDDIGNYSIKIVG